MHYEVSESSDMKQNLADQTSNNCATIQSYTILLQYYYYYTVIHKIRTTLYFCNNFFKC